MGSPLLAPTFVLRGPVTLAQGEYLGAWATAQQQVWDKVLPAQQRLFDSILGWRPPVWKACLWGTPRTASTRCT
jgi:hypothetical protein